MAGAFHHAEEPGSSASQWDNADTLEGTSMHNDDIREMATTCKSRADDGCLLTILLWLTAKTRSHGFLHGEGVSRRKPVRQAPPTATAIQFGADHEDLKVGFFRWYEVIIEYETARQKPFIDLY